MQLRNEGIAIEHEPIHLDRCLKNARYTQQKGISTTKPGTLLKTSIPVRTWHEWDDTRPGFMEMDLVAHCGDSAMGQFIYTLTAVDVSTGWTECLAIPNKTQIAVSNAIIASLAGYFRP